MVRCLPSLPQTMPHPQSTCRPAIWLAVRALLLACSLGLAGCHDGADPQRLMAKARAYHQRGANRSAIIELKNLLQRQPADATARVLLGTIYLDTGDALSAEKELRKALTLGAPRDSIMPQLGLAMLQLGRYQQVLAEIVPSPAQPNPVSQAPLLLVRGNAYLAIGQQEQARQLFEQVRRDAPALAAPLLGLARLAALQDQPDHAATLVGQALAGHPDDIDSLRFRGDLLRQRGDGVGAAATYRRILALRPDNSQARLDLANLAIQSGKFAEAQAELDAARKSAPGKLLVLYGQALLDFRQAHYHAAHESLQQVLRVAPDHMPSVLLMGVVQLALGAPQQAQECLQRFLDVYPRHLYASKTLAQLQLRISKVEAAKNLIMPLLQDHPDDVELLAIAADVHMHAKQYSQASDYLAQATRLAPQSAPLHTALGASLMGMGENSRAISELERATTLDGKQERGGLLLVMTYLRNKDTVRALAAASAMARQQPRNPMVYNLQGGIHLARMDLPAARISFDKALSLDAQYFPALDNLTQIDLAEKKPEQARLRLQAALAKRKGNANLLISLSKLAASQDRKAEAQGWLEQACRDNPDLLLPATLLSALYIQTKAPAKAVLLAQTYQSSHPDEAAALALLAQVQADTGATAAALDSYARLAALQAPSAALHLQVANLHLQLHALDAALQSVKKALALQPDLLEAAISEVGILISQRKFVPALASARAVQQRHAPLAAGYKLEGDVLMAQSQPSAALRAYERAYALMPGGPQMINLHQAMTQAGQARQADARLVAWLLQHPAEQSPRLYLAASLMQAKQYKAAIDQYQQLRVLAPANLVVLNDLAWAYLKTDDQRALPTARRAQALAPGNPAVLDTLGSILIQRGDLAGAVALLRQAAVAAPGDAEIGYHLGLALVQVGDKAGARRQFEQLLSAALDAARRTEVTAQLARL